MNNINKMKRFIEIADKAVFPNNPYKIHIIHHRYFNRKATAALCIRSESFWQTYINLIVRSIKDFTKYIFMSLIFFILPSKLKKEVANMHRSIWLKCIGLMRFNKIQTTPIWYAVIKSSRTNKTFDLDILTTACHEVRHRVQHLNAYKDNVISPKAQAAFLEAFHTDYDEAYQNMKEVNFYEESQYHEEIDANFISMIMATYFKRDFACLKDVNIADIKITEEMFISFMNEYKVVMTWKNPEIEL